MGNTQLLVIPIMLLLSASSSCNKLPKGANPDCYIVKMSTSKGDIYIELSNETPQHRDNFVKLVKEGFYDGRWNRLACWPLRGAWREAYPYFRRQTG